MKRSFAAVVGIFLLLGGCGTEEWVEGGLYSVPSENGSFSVLKILKLDEEGVHLRLYSNQFPSRPKDVDESKLYMAGMKNTRPDESLGMGHAPISRKTFSNWGAEFIKAVPVTDEELDGYKMWLESSGGYF
jgi:hypothetical protein